jgi:crotonobetainyl-CoA:carnitine CoA-transferase CaiB-like acyl-CoA transferase
VPCAPVQTVPELINDPQVKARQMIFDADYPGIGKFKALNLPIKISALNAGKSNAHP